MFVVVQLPILDVRAFLANVRRLGPPWPFANDGDFIRSFGRVERRPRGGIEDWPGDEYFCDASNAVKTPSSLGYGFLRKDLTLFRPRVRFRRLYADSTVARFEVGLHVGFAPDRKDKDGNRPLDALTSLLNLPVRVRAAKSFIQSTLVEAGPALSRLYLRSTTPRGSLRAAQPWWVGAGQPLVVCQYSDLEVETLPPHSTSTVTLDFPDLDLAFCRLETRSVTSGVWFLKTGEGTDIDQLRRVRLHLVRLHAERQAGRALLRLVASRKLDTSAPELDSDALQAWLGRTLRLLGRPTWQGIESAKLLDAAKEVSSLVDPSEQRALVEAVAGFRLTLRQKLARQAPSTPAHIVNKIEIGKVTMTKIVFGDNAQLQVEGNFNVVTAETIEGSFNSAVNATGANAELKEALQALAVQTANLVQRLPANIAEQAAKDLKTLTDEALSKAPRKKWYTLSAEGLIDAAKRVAGMAESMAKAIAAVLKLLN